jgi:hypothetical protein
MEPDERDTPPPREPVTLLTSVERTLKRRAAIDAVRRAGNGTTREQRRALLYAELDRRQLHESPRWVEAKLDTLDPGYKPPSMLGALATIGNLVIDGVDNYKRGGMPGEADPEWLVPPERAKYDAGLLGLVGDRVAVDLDADARVWLDRVHAAATQRFGDSVTIKVWLDWAGDPDATPRQLVVAIGEQRVGLLDATKAFADVMADAARVDKLPFMYGYLTQRPTRPQYLFEVGIPVQRQHREHRVTD